VDDLNLDAVFATVERTESTLGQHALYHRLRSAPVANNLDTFEALVTRLTGDVPSRERAQMALARLQDAHGYDLWWLESARCTGHSILARHLSSAHSEHSRSLLVGNLLAPLSPDGARNDWCQLGCSSYHRQPNQCSGRSLSTTCPLIATAQALAFLTGDDLDPIVEPLRQEPPQLARLKNDLSRWVGGNPFILSLDTAPLALVANDFASVVYEYLNLRPSSRRECDLLWNTRPCAPRASGLLQMISAMG